MTTNWELLNLYELSAGRRVFAANEVARRARALGLSAIESASAQVAEQGREALSLETRWREARATAVSPEAVRVDKALDRALGALHDVVNAHRAGFDDDSPVRKSADVLATRLFPDGAGAIVTLSFTEEVVRTEQLLGLAGGELKDDVARLGATALVQQVAELAGGLRLALEQRGEQVPVASYDQVREARARGNELIASLVVRILETALSRPLTAEQRIELLRPVLDQNEAVRATRARRREPADVNPETGNEQTPVA
jgi:hypothetical protein